MQPKRPRHGGMNPRIRPVTDALPARRSTLGLGILAACVVVGVVLLVWGLTSSSSSVNDALTKGPVPDADLVLDAGHQTVFLEGHDVWNGGKACHCPKVFRTTIEIE